MDILSGGMIKLQVSEAEVNNVSVRFLDKTYVKWFRFFFFNQVNTFGTI